MLHSNTTDAPDAPNIIKPDDNDSVADRALDWPSAPNVVQPDNGGQFTHRYNLRSQANCVLDATTPPPVENSNLRSMANCVIDATAPPLVASSNLCLMSNCVIDATAPPPVASSNLRSMANYVIDATSPLPVESYNRRSQANCVLDATTPLPVENVNSVLKDVSGNLLKYCHIIKGPDAAIWTRSLVNIFGRLAQGVGTCIPKGISTIFFHSPPSGS